MTFTILIFLLLVVFFLFCFDLFVFAVATFSHVLSLFLLFQSCLSVPDIKTAFSDSAPKIGKRDCLVQPCSALTG